MEDYKKKYKNALNKAKDMLKHNEVSQEDMEYLFSELKESEDEEKPNGRIVLEDFNEGNGFYKVNLSYLSKEQVEEIENIVKKWNPEPVESEDEKIRKALIEGLKEMKSSFRTISSINIDDCIAWLEEQSEIVEINPTEFDLRLNKLLKQFKILPKDDIVDTLSFYLNVARNDGTYKADENQNKSVDRKELKKSEQDDRLLQYISKERNKVDFYYNDKEVSRNDIPYGC